MLIVPFLDDEMMTILVFTFQIFYILILSIFMCHFINQVKQMNNFKILSGWLLSEAKSVHAQSSQLSNSQYIVGT